LADFFRTGNDSFPPIEAFLDLCQSRAMADTKLIEAIEQALLELEEQGDIVITSPGLLPVSEMIARKVLDVVPSTEFDRKDISAIKGLLIHLTCGVPFSVDDLPAVTGANLEEFRAIAGKLPLPE
jgi:hypothetical protein